MGLPEKATMKDLINLEDNVVGQLIVQLLIGEPGLSKEFVRYRRSYIRLLKKSLYEYKMARTTLIEWVKDHSDLMKVFVFANHMETCINGISRLFWLLKRIKSDQTSPPLPKTTRRLLEGRYDAFHTIRNTIEHLDERIQKGDIVTGSPVMITINKNEDGINISNHEIKFNELSGVLEKIHSMAPYILTNKKI